MLALCSYCVRLSAVDPAFADRQRRRSSLRSPAARGQAIPSPRTSERLPGPECCPERGRRFRSPPMPSIRAGTRASAFRRPNSGCFLHNGDQGWVRPPNGFRRCRGRKRGCGRFQPMKPGMARPRLMTARTDTARRAAGSGQCEAACDDRQSCARCVQFRLSAGY